MQIRELRLTGNSKKDASISFAPGGNVIAGISDSGKSYILRCIDFVLGAEEMTKKIDEAIGYEFAYVEFINADKTNTITFKRHLNGGDVTVFDTSIDNATGEGQIVLWKRQGKSQAADITSVFFPFAGIQEARLLASASTGVTNRLTIRTLLAAFLVDEGSIIAERSPIYSDTGFDNPSRKRMLSYLLTGKDDSGLIAAAKSKSAQTEARAKIGLIEDLLAPIEKRLSQGQSFGDGEHVLTIERADEAIERLSSSLSEDRQERARLQTERSEALNAIQTAEGQILAIGELLTRYNLLNVRYESDLRRLDFVAEGSYFFEQLQDARCPLCDQPMDDEHIGHVAGRARAKAVYSSAKAEAAKINGLKKDLVDAVSSLEARRTAHEKELSAARGRLENIDHRIDRDLAPALQATKRQLDELIRRRLELEVIRADTEQAETLKTVKAGLETSAGKRSPAPKTTLDTFAIGKFCLEIEALLKEWSWKGQGRVTFDEKSCDIIIDGKHRQSHGKGIRAILHAAFIIGLLKYCDKNAMPHPGFVVIDSPLTTFKQNRDQPHVETPAESKIDPGIETAFWVSIAAIPNRLQIIVFDNKEPPTNVASQLTYTWFAGPDAMDGERRGFIPM
jgi:hypothetical protein